MINHKCKMLNFHFFFFFSHLKFFKFKFKFTIMLLSTQINLFKNSLVNTTRRLNSRYLQTLEKFKSSANLPDNPEFYPGKSSMIRMEEFYNTILNDDLMILTYKDPKSEK